MYPVSSQAYAHMPFIHLVWIINTNTKSNKSDFEKSVDNSEVLIIWMVILMWNFLVDKVENQNWAEYQLCMLIFTHVQRLWLNSHNAAGSTFIFNEKKMSCKGYGNRDWKFKICIFKLSQGCKVIILPLFCDTCLLLFMFFIIVVCSYINTCIYWH